MNNENKLIPDFRPETVQTYTETYTPDGGDEQTATYKIGTAHPIINGILDKFAWIKTHVVAVWWNKQAGVTLKDKIDAMDESIAQLNSKFVIIEISGITDTNGNILIGLGINEYFLIGAIITAPEYAAYIPVSAYERHYLKIIVNSADNKPYNGKIEGKAIFYKYCN